MAAESAGAADGGTVAAGRPGRAGLVCREPVPERAAEVCARGDLAVLVQHAGAEARARRVVDAPVSRDVCPDDHAAGGWAVRGGGGAVARGRTGAVRSEIGRPSGRARV